MLTCCYYGSQNIQGLHTTILSTCNIFEMLAILESFFSNCSLMQCIGNMTNSIYFVEETFNLYYVTYDWLKFWNKTCTMA